MRANRGSAETRKVQLDGDFRRDPKTERYCVRCQKDIKPEASAIRVSVDEASISVWRDENGEHLMGMDCAKKVGL